ncbi:uncharacterized [Tachysurus ichikawai]
MHLTGHELALGPQTPPTAIYSYALLKLDNRLLVDSGKAQRESGKQEQQDDGKAAQVLHQILDNDGPWPKQVVDHLVKKAQLS